MMMMRRDDERSDEEVVRRGCDALQERFIGTTIHYITFNSKQYQ